MKKYSPVVFVLAAIVLLGAPFVAYPVFLIDLLTATLLAASLNLLIGYVGLLAFGQAMFYGTSCYITAYALKFWGLDAVPAILLGVAVAAVLGFLTGVLAIRCQGIYFSMITLAFAQLIYFVALRIPDLGGDNGLQDVPRSPLFGLIDTTSNLRMYYVALGLVVLAMWFIYRIVHSPFGQVLKAIRDNEPRAASLGYHVNRFKLIALTISAALAGLAGSIKVMALQLATLTDVSWATSGDALLICVVGGLQTLVGPVIGSIVIVSIQHYLAFASEWVPVIQGAVFIVIAMLFRKGIVGTFYAWRDRRRERQTETIKEVAFVEAGSGNP
ncbi:branched-chain amino acid ABC transporter permease [Paraburkholderia unamae]|uniref:Amino acid/amide ABC transporter membrane protein 2 (HAAT family) n=1 Tax=Paraburkholderia unamae TaxID=219649 RepID=A0ABX5KT43_9BURK|nr:branched-chain amino acid ABC transporter permease [Paraburkholderia unamae]PVX84939.1 amino acid/amide ABC transporter membrane protein 2 (HAAT family) [Paraburkholderia unamae]